MLSRRKIIGYDEGETRLLSAMAEDARQYIRSFLWAPPEFELELMWGVGNVLAIFLLTSKLLIGGTDDRLWVVVGDLPSAYLVIEPDDSPREAIDRYCDLMSDWCDAVENNTELSQVYPVRAAPTAANADLLERRIKFIREDLMARIPGRAIG